MTKPQLETIPAFYKNYVENVKDMDVIHALEHSSRIALATILAIPEEQGEYRYADDKWSIKELLAHLIDTERIMAYRALRFSRNDTTDLPGFDEKKYAPEANAHVRTIKQLGDELERLRLTTLDLYSSFSQTMLLREGTANKNKLSVLNLGYVIAGHEIHHLNILRQRYLKK